MSDALTFRPPPMRTLLRLGRVSNLPTVWTNVLAAVALAGAEVWTARTIVVLVAMTLFYVGGMYLNDVFDREIDAAERPSRPIPAGEVAPAFVLGAGFAMLAIGVALLAACGLAAGLSGLALASTVLIYDLRHKGEVFSPVVMGLCRALVYIGAALATAGQVDPLVLVGALAGLAHVVGLTYAAKQEALDQVGRLWPLAVLALPLALAIPLLPSHPLALLPWLALAAANIAAVDVLRRRSAPGAVPRAVVALIAAISLLDALFAAAAGAWAVSLVCAAGWPLTRLLQRVVPGT